MDKDSLFIRTLEDLDGRMKSQDEYEILMIAGLLRKLFLDNFPLVDQVNRNFRQKIRFTVNERSAPAGKSVMFWSIEDGLDPDTGVPGLRNPVEVTKDQLFSRPVLMLNGTIFTVKELIQNMAHVQGAVHAGSPKDEKEKVLKQISEMFAIGGLPAGLRLLCAIGRVVSKGLNPLKEQIINQT